jgi:hypothetical protein
MMKLFSIKIRNWKLDFHWIETLIDIWTLKQKNLSKRMNSCIIRHWSVYLDNSEMICIGLIRWIE